MFGLVIAALGTINLTIYLIAVWTDFIDEAEDIVIKICSIVTACLFVLLIIYIIIP